MSDARVRGDRWMTLLRACLAVATVTMATWHVVAAAWATPPPPEDMITPGLALYREVAIDLPPHGRMGFLPTGPNDTFNSANYFIAQYALAPRVLLHSFVQVDFVITGVNATPTTDERPELTGFTPVAVRDRGVRIYRRVDR